MKSQRWLWLSVVLVGTVGTLVAQAPTLTFEVASVKPSPKGTQYGTSSVWEFTPRGDATFRNATVRIMIALAYQIDTQFQDKLLVGTQDQLTERFDIQAKAPAGIPERQGSVMLRALLEERFKLRTHLETRQVPVFSLALAREGRLGRDLRRTSIDCARFDRSSEPLDTKVSQTCLIPARRDAQKARLHEMGPLSTFIRRMQAYVDRPVQDATGLEGLFEWDVTFSVERIPAPDSEFPTVEAALADQLGLRLVPRSAPLEVRVIDSVERPTEN